MTDFLTANKIYITSTYQCWCQKKKEKKEAQVVPLTIVSFCNLVLLLLHIDYIIWTQV